ncbi:MAG: extracellular solute-binding protein [Ruminococcus sp.]|nr:extracellular solute-binding protein [Ruminococcus sp.]
MKKVYFLLCFALLISSITSCSSVSSDSSTSSDSSISVQQSSRQNDSDEKKDDIVLTMAMSGDPSSIEKAIEEFNATNNGCQVQLKRYFEDYDEDGNPIARSAEEYQYQDLEILQDITNKGSIDIVCNVSFVNEAYYDIFQNKGAFADLYTFMASDPEVNNNTLDTHILNINEINGKLYSMPTFYSVNTMCGDSQYVGTKENWTFDEFEKHWNAMPAGSTLTGATDKEAFFDVLLRYNLNSFVDYENTQVNFDSPEFKKILEFCNQFEAKTGDKSIYDYDAPSMVTPFMVNAIMNAPMFDQDNGKTCVGYPSSDGKGAYLSSFGFCFSICANISSERQKAAWEFIRTFVTEEWQIENAIPYVKDMGAYDGYYSSEMGLCVNKNAFDTIAERLINKEYYPKTRESKGVEFETRFPSEKEVRELRRYIESVDRWENTISGSINEIVYDEVSAYFAGEKTLDECVSLIQNRASIWISEQA